MIVLDTNVLSEAMRASPAPRVAEWMARERAANLFTTAITEAEILLGIAMLPDGRRKNELQAAAQRVFSLFASRILSFESTAASSFAAIAAGRRHAGLPINDFDALIASIARSRGMALATRNVADFEGTGVDLINPWDI
jgi:predicted nucleic acid-binding protein